MDRFDIYQCSVIRKTILRYFKGRNHCENQEFPLTHAFWLISSKWPLYNFSVTSKWHWGHWDPWDMGALWTHWCINGDWWSTGQKEISGPLSPHICLWPLCNLQFTSKQGLGIDYMHRGSICSHGIIFPEIKEQVTYAKSGIPVHEAP